MSGAPSKSQAAIPQVGKAAAGKIAALIDGGCEMCQAGARAIKKFDTENTVEILDLTEPLDRARFPDLKLEDLTRELHVVDERGRIFRGARAINEILRHQRGPKRLLSYLWYLPGYARFADRQYKRIAATRYARDAGGRLKPTGGP
jgi:predicted DCC family thiol-disulfide oxidoreductase YuxK